MWSHSFTLRQLQYIVSVYKCLNFRQAAEECAVSQPSLSAQVAQVEAFLGVTLFERTRRSVRVTRQGEDFVAVKTLTKNTVLVVLEPKTNQNSIEMDSKHCLTSVFATPPRKTQANSETQ